MRSRRDQWLDAKMQFSLKFLLISLSRTYAKSIIIKYFGLKYDDTPLLLEHGKIKPILIVN